MLSRRCTQIIVHSCLVACTLLFAALVIPMAIRSFKCPFDSSSRRTERISRSVVSFLSQKATASKFKCTVDSASKATLAIGDSITAGWYTEAGQTKFHPYTIELSVRFHMCGCCTYIANRGVPGATTVDLIKWLPDILQFNFINTTWENATTFSHTLTYAGNDNTNVSYVITSTARTAWDYVVLLIGTNDLIQGWQPNDTLHRVQGILRTIQTTLPDATVFLLDLPVCRTGVSSTFYTLCMQYQAILQPWLLAEKAKQTKLEYVDIASVIPYTNQTKSLFLDQVHFTPAGYDVMGNYIFEIMKQWESASTNQTSFFS
jgi:lysophospholipase L1-like esterase